MKTIVYQKINIDVGTDTLGRNDKGTEFETIKEALLVAWDLSESLGKKVDVILNTDFEDGEYKIQKIATVNANILNTSINGYYKPDICK